MKRKGINNIEIDFDTGSCKKTFVSQLPFIKNELYSYRNSYVGNKRKIIDKILYTLNENNFKYDSVLDLFAGSGYVSAAFKMLGKTVISNDILKSSYINLIGIIENNNFLIDKEMIKLFNNIDDDNLMLEEDNNFLHRFTKNELLYINNFIYNLKKWYYSNPSKQKFYQVALIYSSFQNYIGEKCFIGGRLNNGQVIADLDHRLKHKKNKMKEMLFKNIKLNFPIKSNKKCKVYNKDAIELIDYLNKKNISVDMCYIDPPYGGSQSDYFKMYEFHENLINKYDFYKIFNITKNDINFMKDKDKFVKNKNYENNFNVLCSKIKNIPLIAISYNNSSWSSIDKIISIIKKYRKNVKVENFEYKYQYRNSFSSGKEYLILIN